MALKSPPAKLPALRAAIDAIRDFNRLYTRQMGLLDKDLLGSAFSLTEARVLYELANRKESTATQIADELGLDLGYLSRVLKKFERERFIRRARSAIDARQSQIHLTKKGRTEFASVDRAARKQILTMIDPLTVEQRHELVAAMQAIRHLIERSLGHAERKAYSIRPLRVGDIGWITHRQGVLYAQEYGWDVTYEALVAQILSAFINNFDSNAEAAWVAELDYEIAGSVFLVRESASLAKLRLLYVEPTARGWGIGRRLVEECINVAREKGYKTLTLWTNDVLVSARRIYEAAGFILTKEERHHSFGKDLLGQNWDLAL